MYKYNGQECRNLEMKVIVIIMNVYEHEIIYTLRKTFITISACFVALWE